MRTLAALLLVAAVLTACGSESTTDDQATAQDPAASSQSPTTEPTAPSDDETSSSPKPEVKPASGPELSTRGLSCSVPKGWAVTSADAPAGVLLSATDLRDADDGPTMITVSRSSQDPASVKAAEARSSAALTSAGVTRVVVDEPTTVGGHEASHVHGISAAAGHNRLDEYVVPVDDATWVIRISTNRYLTNDYRGRTIDSILVSCRV